nr:MAG TPA: hypothetical protein [Caudoviricetes sp.]
MFEPSGGAKILRKLKDNEIKKNKQNGNTQRTNDHAL